MELIILTTSLHRSKKAMYFKDIFLFDSLQGGKRSERHKYENFHNKNYNYNFLIIKLKIIIFYEITSFFPFLNTKDHSF